MHTHHVTAFQLHQFGILLHDTAHADGTIAKYLRDARDFLLWSNNQLSASLIVDWKKHLLLNGYAPTTINSKLSALNTFCATFGWHDCKTPLMKIQHRLFLPAERELTLDDYHALIATARSLNKQRLALLTETLAATGIRVSELQYITRETVEKGRADIALKGKIRTILLPDKLCRKLLKYAKKEKIASGVIFVTRSGKRIDRRQIWAELKELAGHAGIDSRKVFPHNLRHLFAVTYYQSNKDIVRLADILGHSSVETTRIYLIGTGVEHQRQLNRLKFVS